MNLIYALFVMLFHIGANAKYQQLKQNDFDNGTVILSSGSYILTESIEFNPFPYTLNIRDAYEAGWPQPWQLCSNGGYLPDDAYALGFFSAIALNGSNIIIDLNGHAIQQSKEHALLQRFFAIIELGMSPFIMNQGPHDFTNTNKFISNITIKNGIIGRSSHHGIHGNGNKDVTISNIKFIDFEVAAVALNGVENLLIEECIGHSRIDVPVLGTFSSARFIKPYIDWLASHKPNYTIMIQGNNLTSVDIQTSLRETINNVHKSIIINELNYIDKNLFPNEYAMFHNIHHVIDGNTYGFLINKLGVAVNGFPYNITMNKHPATNIMFKNVSITYLKGAINEIIALNNVNDDNNPITDVRGAVFQIQNTHPDTQLPITVTDLTLDAKYIGNAIANTQAIIGKAIINKELKKFGVHQIKRSSFNQQIIRWIEESSNLSTYSDFINPQQVFICNGDSMFHVNKGVIGFKIDAAINVVMHGCTASRLSNLGDIASSKCNYNKDEYSHPQATLSGYGGGHVRGFTFAGSSNITCIDCAVSDLHSKYGNIIGFDILTDSTDINMNSPIAIGMTYATESSAYDSMLQIPMGTPYTSGIKCSGDTHNISIHNHCIINVIYDHNIYNILDLSDQIIDTPHPRCPFQDSFTLELDNTSNAISYTSIFQLSVVILSFLFMST